MPIPKPKKNEEKEEFINRCMSDEIMNDEYPDSKKRAGICYTAWKNKDKKAMDKENKGITTDFEIEAKEINENDRTIEFIVTKEVVDADGDLVKVSGIDFTRFDKNPVVLFGHDRRGLPIGKVIKRKTLKDNIKMRVKFPTPEEYSVGDTVYKLVKGGYINAVSMSFFPDYETVEYPKGLKVHGKSVRRVINKSEFLELSILPLPSNPDALRINKALEDKVIDEIEYKELQLITKEIQANNEAKDIIEEKALDLAEENKELKLQIEALKLQIEEKELEEELEEDFNNDYLKSIFDEFDLSYQAADEGKHIDKHIMDDKSIDEIIKEEIKQWKIK